MTDAIAVEIQGLVELQREFERIVRDMHGSPMLGAMRTATLLVQRDAKINAPWDTGRLRSSITPEVKAEGNTIIGVVGSNVFYAPFQEFGWRTRGGRRIAGKRYLQRAFESNEKKIFTLIESAAVKITGAE